MTDPLEWTGVRHRVLRALANAAEPLWPLGLAHATGIPYGTVYDTFRRLHDLGWAVGITETCHHPGRPARVYYRLTPLGREKTKGLR